MAQLMHDPESREGERQSDPELHAPPKVHKLFLFGALWAALVSLESYAGYFVMNSYFGKYDDEGYWLIALRSYHSHGSLYHHTYSQAGPFYYEVWSSLYSLLGLTIGWDSGRLITLVVWILTSLTVGIAIWVLSRRFLIALLAEMVSYLVLLVLDSVSMEPAGLAHLLGAVALLGFALFVRNRQYLGMTMIAAASTAAVFTKANVGIFLSAGTITAVALFWPGKSWDTFRKIAAGFAVLAIPLLLMEQVLNRRWAGNFAGIELIYLVGLLAIVLTRKPTSAAFSLRHVAVGGAVAVGTSAVISLAVLANGTSLSELLHGAFLGPRGLARVGHSAVPILPADLALALVSTTVAIMVAVYSATHGHRPRWLDSIWTGYVRFGVGVWILLVIFGLARIPRGLQILPTLSPALPYHSFLLAAPLAWIAAVGGADQDGPSAFVRAAVSLIAVLGCLEAFPVAGSQFGLAAFSLVPVGAICIADGLQRVSRHRISMRWAGDAMVQMPLASLILALVTFLVLESVDRTLLESRAVYRVWEPVRLLGAHNVHLPPAQVKELRQVTKFLKTECSTYWSLPGFNSFYFFAKEAPPTGLNSSQSWWDVLSASQQNDVLRDLRHTPRLCLIEDRSFRNQEIRGVHVIQTPLVRYIENDFVVAQKNRAYVLLVRSTPGVGAQ